MPRISFNEVFDKQSDGTLEVRQTTRVGGVVLGRGVKLRGGVTIGGVDFHDFEGSDLEIKTDKETIVVKGIYERRREE